MTARKSATKKTRTKATAKKAPAKKSPAKKTTAKKTTAKKKSAAKKSPAKKAPAKKAAPSKAKSGVSSLDVNLGHVFALRPRVSASFRQEHFRSARQLLQDEGYASLTEAARAVAEKALELTHEGGSRLGTRRGR